MGRFILGCTLLCSACVWGNPPEEGALFDVFLALPVELVFADRPPKLPIPPESHVIGAARGESEPVQLVLKAKEDIEGITVSCSDLEGDGGTLPAGQVEIGVVGHVIVKGEPWPDPIFPQPVGGISVGAGRQRAWWITVNVPKDQPAGKYKGTLDVRIGGATVQSAPLAVQVFDFQFTEPYPIAVNVGLMGVDSGVLDLACRRKMFPAHCVRGVGRARFSLDAHGTLTADFSEFDAATERLRSEFGMRRICLGFIVGDGSGASGYPQASFTVETDASDGKMLSVSIDPARGEAERERFHDVMRQYTEHLRERGWLLDAYVYLYDEPQDAQSVESLKTYAQFFQEAAPEIPALVVRAPTDDLPGSLDIWCSLVNQCTDEAAQWCGVAGKEHWIYTCGGEQHPSLDLGKPALDARVLGWVAFRYRATGVLCWGVDVGYRECRLVEPLVYADIPRNGDGVLFYPTCEEGGEPLPSIRSENLRDGIEDAIVLMMVEEDPAVGNILRDYLGEFVSDQFKRSTDPRHYTALRNLAYDRLAD